MLLTSLYVGAITRTVDAETGWYGMSRQTTCHISYQMTFQMHAELSVGTSNNRFQD